ncbi:MAG: HEAT repeat domain-containing protein [Deltaproteobacteria bacterium]|nr:HEAT repeat domain-containing protein [Deltaproteobacteria bacterium]
MRQAALFCGYFALTAALTAIAAASASAVLEAADDRVASLVDTLAHDPSFKVRLQAAVKLGRTKDSRAVAALLDALRDEHYTVRGAACMALANMGAIEAVQPLLLVAASDDDEDVRSEAKRALTRFDKEQAWPELLQASGTSDVETRLEAIALIAQWQDDRARLRLIEALGDNDRIVRVVQDTLAGMAPAAKVELLRLGLDSPKLGVRMKATQLLGDVGDDKAIAILMDAYEEELESDELRRAIREQLRRLKAKLPVVELLKDAQKGEERFGRARALKFLGVIGGEECQRVLVEALKDDDIYVRGVAALALAEAGDARAIPALRKLIEDQENARIVQIVRNSIQILERKK